jgi:anti-anti-sigma regulatory factor
MLRIRHDDGDAREIRIVLEGRIVGAWAEILERECVEAFSSGRHVLLDVSGVVFIGRSGFEALARLSRAGIGIAGYSPLIAAMLEQAGIAVDKTTH